MIIVLEHRRDSLAMIANYDCKLRPAVFLLKIPKLESKSLLFISAKYLHHLKYAYSGFKPTWIIRWWLYKRECVGIYYELSANVTASHYTLKRINKYIFFSNID